MCTSPALSSRPAPHLTVSQVAALEPDGSLFFSSVTGGAGVWSWSSVIVVGAGFTTTVPRRVTWAGESSRHIEVLVQGHCRNGGEVQPSRLLLSIAPNTRLLPSPPGLGADAGTAGLPSHLSCHSPTGLGAAAGTDDPYLLMPRAYNPLLGNVPLFPAFPLYSVTPISGNISLSAIGTSSTFPATHLIMSSPLVNLTVDIAQAFQVHREGQ